MRRIWTSRRLLPRRPSALGQTCSLSDGISKFALFFYLFLVSLGYGFGVSDGIDGFASLFRDILISLPFFLCQSSEARFPGWGLAQAFLMLR